MTTSSLSKEARVYQLYKDLEHAKLQKKLQARIHNDEIKRIQSEIKDIINEENP